MLAGWLAAGLREWRGVGLVAEGLAGWRRRLTHSTLREVGGYTECTKLKNTTGTSHLQALVFFNVRVWGAKVHLRWYFQIFWLEATLGFGGNFGCWMLTLAVGGLL